jgi:hypothetical protein
MQQTQMFGNKELREAGFTASWGNKELREAGYTASWGQTFHTEVLFVYQDINKLLA